MKRGSENSDLVVVDCCYSQSGSNLFRPIETDDPLKQKPFSKIFIVVVKVCLAHKIFIGFFLFIDVVLFRIHQHIQFF